MGSPEDDASWVLAGSPEDRAANVIHLLTTITTLTAQLDKAHDEGRRWMEYADELKDTVMAAEAEIANLTAQRDAAEKDRDEWKEAAIYENDKATQRMWDNLRLVGKLTAAEKVCEAAEAWPPECLNFPPDSPYNCYRVDPKPYLDMPCLACALTEWRRTQDADN